MPWRHPQLWRRSEPQVSGKVRHSASWREVARGTRRCLGCIRLPPLIYFLHLEIAPDLASSGDPRLGHEKVRKTEGLWGEREQRIRASESGREAFKAHPAPLGASPPRPAHAGGARRSGSGSHGAYKPGAWRPHRCPSEPRTRQPRACAELVARPRPAARGRSELRPAPAGAAEPGGEGRWRAGLCWGSFEASPEMAGESQG